jgi:hypothetical protein
MQELQSIEPASRRAATLKLIFFIILILLKSLLIADKVKQFVGNEQENVEESA